MSEKCLYCSTPIEQKEGKRERKFCSPSHCTMYNLREKNKDKPKGKAGRPAGAKNKKPTTSIGVLKEAIQNMGNEPVAVTTPEKHSNPKVTEIRKKWKENKDEFLSDTTTMPKGLSLTQQLEWREKQAGGGQ